MPKKEKPRVNVKARLNRHLRIIKENIGVPISTKKKEVSKSNNHFNIVLFFVLLVIPIYPTLASFMYNTSRYDFYRGNIDESSIIESYFTGDEDVDEINSPILESTDSFISVNTILDDERDLDGTNEIVEYEVKPGESFYSISYNFKVSTNSIYWANDFGKTHTLQPGEVIKVPPVTGLIHQVKSGDTILAIAKKYDIEDEKIIKQNGLEEGSKLIAGEVIVIPGAIKIAPKPKPRPKPTIAAKKGYSFTSTKGSTYVETKGKFKLVWRKPQHTFYWGNCTWYVAKYKNVNWGGNANAWIRNAEAKGHETGSEARIGSIVQFTGRGYNPKYGHVGIVMDIIGEDIIISDMNYRRLNEVTYRKIPMNHRGIDGYIYVD